MPKLPSELLAESIAALTAEAKRAKQMAGTRMMTGLQRERQLGFAAGLARAVAVLARARAGMVDEESTFTTKQS